MQDSEAGSHRPASELLGQRFSPIHVARSIQKLHEDFLNDALSVLAHDDAIWSVAWGTNKKENSETVVTGSLDDLVKVWKW